MERAPDEPAPHSPGAEVRYATVLKCDIVGSTRIKRGLDMDGQFAFKQGLEELIRRVAGPRHGHVERFEGDGALVLFGYPHAREDAAEDAVFMALDIVNEIHAATFLPNVQMQIRVGVASGPLAVVKEPMDDRSEPVAGIVIDMAERLRAFAEPDRVIICDATRRLAGAYFEYDDLGEVPVKGFEEGVRAWRIGRPSSIASRFEAQRYDESRSEILGRADALSQLTSAWSDARKGNGRVVYLVGEAGIGKSRLAKATLDLASEENAAVLKLDCLPSTGNTPLFPVGVLLRRIADVTAAVPEHDRRALAGTFLRRFLADNEVPAALDYLAPLFGLQTATLPARHTPDQVRDQTTATVLRMLRAQAMQKPLALLCEDLHWSDDTTASLMHRVADEVRGLPILVIVTSRPETDHLAKVANADVIRLQPLDRDTSSVLVRSVAKTTTLPSDLVEKIVERCEGNPLLLEEVTRGSVEARSGGQALPIDAQRRGTVPTPLKLVVESRLGRRPELEPVVQAAAVLGREFSVGALEHMMSATPGSQVHQALSLFSRDGLFAPWDADSGDRAKFRHAMFRDAVDEMLMGDDRRRLHSDAADILRKHFSGTTDASAEVLAEHLRVAERFIESIKLRLEASADTAARGAYVETEGHCEAALQLVDKVEEIDQGRELQFDLLLRLGVARTGRHGYASPEAETVYRRALEVCGEGAEAAKLYPIIRGLATVNLVRGKLAVAYDLSLRGLELAELSGRPEFRIDAMSVLCYTTLYFGKLTDCRKWIERCLALYREEKGDQFTYPVPQDAATAALALLPTVAWLLGDAQSAEDAIRDGLAHVERLNRDFDRALMHAWIAGTRYTQRRYHQAEEHAMVAIGISKDKYSDWAGTGALMMALAQAAREPAPEALAQATALCTAFASQGVGLNASYYLLGLARGHAQLAQAPVAHHLLGEASRSAEASEETRMNAEILLLKGELEPDADTAMSLLANALEIAEAQGALATSLRIVATMALRSGKAHLAEAARDALEALDRGPPYPPQPDWMRARIDELRKSLQPKVASARRA